MKIENQRYAKPCMENHLVYGKLHAFTVAHVTQPWSCQYTNPCFAAVGAAERAPGVQLCESHVARALGSPQASLQSDAAWFAAVADYDASTAASPARGAVEVNVAAYENVRPSKVAAPHPLRV